MKNRKVMVLTKKDKKDGEVEVRTITGKGQLCKRRFPSMAQALAHIQCPKNHFVPALIDGYPTIINALVRALVAKGAAISFKRQTLRKPSCIWARPITDKDESDS